ncbi:CpXC domain-containing protein [uncultured Holdemanella sp.]|uniref:CpXC domain-containing protein n=1 Tax=uncultured Holdemanella sp. TaxID=1763549 RepID=UPI00280572B5|nr:CpXC domain-containing protein [uncultured Holdemanella sp.]
MKERMIPVTCPHCGHVFEIKRDTVVIAQMDTVAKKRLDDGSYFMHQCQNCKKMFYLYYPFLYRDPKKKFDLVLTQNKTIEQLPEDEQVVLCHSVTQFLLAFKIYDQCLNPVMVINKKKMLEKKLGHSIKFDYYDKKNHCLWFEDVAVSLTEKECKEILIL